MGGKPPGRRVILGKNLEVRENTGPAAAPGSVELQGRGGVGAIGMGIRREGSQEENGRFRILS